MLLKILAPVRRVIAIRSSLGLSRFQTLAIGKASDQAAVWLFYAVSSRQWFQGLGVLSRGASESLQVRSSQVDYVSFCRGDESKIADQASVALITSPWGNREREATCWRGLGRRRTTIGNMAETGLRRNGDQTDSWNKCLLRNETDVYSNK